MIRKLILASIAFLFAITTFLAMPVQASDYVSQDSTAQYSQQDQRSQWQNNQLGDQKQYAQTNQRFQADQSSGQQQQPQSYQSNQRSQEDQSYQNQGSQSWQQQPIAVNP